MINCQICGLERKVMKTHLRNSHNMDKDTYLVMYPGSKLVSEEESARRSKSWKGYYCTLTDEEKSDRGKLSRAGWTNESSRLVVEHRNASITEEAKQAKSNAMQLGQEKARLLDSNYDINRGKAISAGWKIHLEDPKALEAARARMNVANSVWHNTMRNMSEDELYEFLNRSFLRGPKKYFFVYKDQTYGVRSSYEEIVLKKLVDKGIDFRYENPRMRHHSGYLYIPDFTIGLLVLEVKAKYYYDENQNRMRKEACEESGYEYKLLTEDHIFHSNLDLIIDQLPTSARPLCKESDDIVRAA